MELRITVISYYLPLSLKTLVKQPTLNYPWEAPAMYVGGYLVVQTQSHADYVTVATAYWFLQLKVLHATRYTYQGVKMLYRISTESLE